MWLTVIFLLMKHTASFALIYAPPTKTPFPASVFFYFLFVLPPVLSHLASLVHAASLFSFGTRINLFAVYEAAVVSQIEVDRRVGRLLDGKTDGQGRDLKRGDLPLKSEMNMQTRSAVRKTGERQFYFIFFSVSQVGKAVNEMEAWLDDDSKAATLKF